MDELNSDELGKLVEMVHNFENALETEEVCPNINSLLEAYDERFYSVALKQLLSVELEYRIQRGSFPKVGKYLKDYPKYQDIILSVFKETPNLPPDLGEEYEFCGVLGEGGFCNVFQYYDNRHKRDVAVKVWRAGSQYDSQRKYALAEAHKLACLNTVSGVVKHYETRDLQDGRIAIVMEVIRGDTLSDRIRKGMSLDDTVAIARELATVMHKVHLKGIVHRDLKSENIIIRDNKVHVTDFGLAIFVDQSSEQDRAGTLLCMAPEQLVSGQEINATADIWAIGVILYKMLVGKLPFATAEQILNDSPTAPTSLNNEVPKHVSRVCLKCLSKNRIARYQNAFCIAEDLAPGRSWQVIPALFVLASLALTTVAIGYWVTPVKQVIEVNNGQDETQAFLKFVEDGLLDSQLRQTQSVYRSYGNYFGNQIRYEGTVKVNKVELNLGQVRKINHPETVSNGSKRHAATTEWEADISVRVHFAGTTVGERWVFANPSGDGGESAIFKTKISLSDSETYAGVLNYHLVHRSYGEYVQVHEENFSSDLNLDLESERFVEDRILRYHLVPALRNMISKFGLRKSGSEP